MQKSAPGWFNDGSGQQRWWDGDQWTNYFFDATAGAVVDRESASSEPARPSAPKARGGWKFKVIGLAVIIVVIVVIWGFGGLLLASGLAAGAVGLYAVLKGSFGPFRIRSRPVAVAVLVAGVFVSSIGGAALAASQPPSSDVAAFVAAGSASKRSVAPTSAPPSPTPTPTPTPVRTEAIIEESAPIAFTTSSVDDPNLDAGLTAVATAGVDGQKVTRIRVVSVDGVEVSREAIEEVVTVQPVNEVIATGSRQPPPPPPAPVDNGCDPNYEGACVPIASDVDCAGGSGNGPAYVDGPVWIVGSDIYDLDRDGDGIACDR